MSRRYGRNQKRAARTRIAELAEALIAEGAARNQAEGRMRNAETRAIHAREAAFEQFARVHGLLDTVASTIGRELGRSLGPALMPHAEKLMAAQCGARSPRFEPTLRIEDMPYVYETRVTGSLPELRYSVQIAHIDFEAFSGRGDAA